MTIAYSEFFCLVHTQTHIQDPVYLSAKVELHV